jgi:hypothetical protein
MARGGRRAGTRGAAYPGRTDLQMPQAPQGLPYGDRAKLMAAQQAVPMAAPPAPAAPMSGAGQAPPPPGPAPGTLPFTGPTQRPNEPVTHGLPVGPGAGPEVLSMNQVNDPLVTAVAALNALGDTADVATKHLRDSVSATLANRSVP